MSNAEFRTAVQDRTVQRVLWGRDFPHTEGTWPNTRLSLRMTCEDIPADAIRGALGLNAITAYGLDPADMTSIAARIGPSLGDLSLPVSDDELPESHCWTMAFRRGSAWC
jgi:hypothetical protein